MTFTLNLDSELNDNSKKLFDCNYNIWALAMPYTNEELKQVKYKKKYDKMVKSMSKIINMEKDSLNIFIPFFIERDSILIKDISKFLNINYIIYNINYDNRKDVRSLFKNASKIICMRYHSILFSIFSNAKFIAVSYSPKLTRVLLENDITNNYVEMGIRKSEFFYKEFDILYELVVAGGKVVTRKSLLSKLWDYEYCEDTRIVDTHIKNIRKKLGEAIALLPGKSEQWLMLGFADRCRLFAADHP